MITVVPVGEVKSGVLEILRQALAEAFGQRTWVGDGIKLPMEGRDQRRGQYISTVLLAELPSPPNLNDRVLGVADVDLFAPGLNFIFGEADIAGRRALISIIRLRQEFYGLPKNENLFQERTVKEAVHELGHTFGLEHCPNRACVMHFSNSLPDTDAKGWSFCPACSRKVRQRLL